MGRTEVGGLVGFNSEGRVFSYWNTDVISIGIGDRGISGAEGKTTAELKAPTGHTGIYARWDPQFWDFGTDSQYPLLKADMDGDGTATWQEFGPQSRATARRRRRLPRLSPPTRPCLPR